MKTSSKFFFLQSRHYGCFAVPYILHSENFNVTVLCHEKHKFYWCWVYNPFTWMGYHLFSIYGLQKRQLLSIYQESFNFHRTNFPIYTNTEEKYPTRLLLNSRFQNNRHIQEKNVLNSLWWILNLLSQYRKLNKEKSAHICENILNISQTVFQINPEP